MKIKKNYVIMKKITILSNLRFKKLQFTYYKNTEMLTVLIEKFHYLLYYCGKNFEGGKVRMKQSYNTRDSRRQNKYSIRKFSVGAASLMIGALFFVGSDVAFADETTTTSTQNEKVNTASPNEPSSEPTEETSSETTEPVTKPSTESVKDDLITKENTVLKAADAATDTVPTIAVTSPNNLKVGETFDPMAGVTATDVEDGDITSKITVVSNNVDTSKAGTYQVIYEVVDADGNKFTASREILVSDSKPASVPTITNSASNNLTQGDTFDPMAGITATDVEDGDITSKVTIVSNNVDTNTPGTYTIVYSVTDSSNQTFRLTHTVKVAAKVVADTNIPTQVQII